MFEIKNELEFNSKLIEFLILNKDKGVLCNKNNLPFGFFETEVITPSKKRN